MCFSLLDTITVPDQHKCAKASIDWTSMKLIDVDLMSQTNSCNSNHRNGGVTRHFIVLHFEQNSILVKSEKWKAKTKLKGSMFSLIWFIFLYFHREQSIIWSIVVKTIVNGVKISVIKGRQMHRIEWRKKERELLPKKKHQQFAYFALI